MPIELKSVSYTYAPNTPYSAKALDKVSVKINDGEFIGIIGKTGCGKSTLIQIIDGLLAPSDGVVLFNGKDINAKNYDRNILRKNIGVVFQSPEYQLFETTVERDVAFGLKPLKLKQDEIQDSVCEALCAVGFDYNKVKDKSPLGFSGGEKRRIAIAGVLAVKPKFLILDEPIAGLDPTGRNAFLKLISKLNQNGTSIIMISHNIDAIAEYTSRVILMENGCILCDGKTEDVLSDYNLLEKSGINNGQVYRIAKMLRQKGFDIPSNTVKYNQLIESICRTYGRNQE